MDNDNKLSFAIHTLGCKVNTYESDAMAESLKNAGFVERGFNEKADVYIVNTCTVTNIADRKSRQMLRRARKTNPNALIAAAGCFVDDAKREGMLDELIAEGIIDIAIKNSDKARASALISDALRAGGPHLRPRDSTLAEPDSDHAEKPSALTGFNTRKDEPAGKLRGNTLRLSGISGHTRAFIKIQDGCSMFCSYCVIPYVRGEVYVRPAEETLDEIRTLAASGTAEVVLTGINISSMGDKLIDLVESVSEIDGIKRIRLGSLEPELITEKRAGRLRKCVKLCPHFHLALQSGSDRILKAMNRHYTTARYMEKCEILRDVFEHPAITTDIIVGFPGETYEDFLKTCEFAERVGFYEAHVFKYSKRKGTAAETMPGQLTDRVKSLRSEKLIDISGRMSDRFREYYVGKTVAFLSEEITGIGGEAYEIGYTPEYVRAAVRSDVLHRNQIIEGKAVRFIADKASPRGESIAIIE